MTAKVDWTKPIQTRDGRKAELLCVLENGNNERNHVCKITDDDGSQWTGEWTVDGFLFTAEEKSKFDIINTPAPPKMLHDVVREVLERERNFVGSFDRQYLNAAETALLRRLPNIPVETASE